MPAQRLPMKNFIPFNIWTHPQCCHFSKIMSHFFLIIQGQIYVFNAEGKKGKEISHLYLLLIKLDECAVLWRNGYFELNSNRLIRLILFFLYNNYNLAMIMAMKMIKMKMMKIWFRTADGPTSSEDQYCLIFKFCSCLW